MEVKLVHPSDPEKKVVVATDEQQVAAYRNHGFVDESDLAASAAEASASEDAAKELAELKAENKALKSENTKLKNKLSKVAPDAEEVPDSDEPEGKPEDEEENK
jgi:cell division protein FtsB